MNITPNDRNQQSGAPTGEGVLVVRVTTARGAIPLEGALVSVRSYDGALDEGRSDVIATLTSGRDGNTAPLRLPAPPRSASLSPGNGTPYTNYIVEVTLEGYTAQEYLNVPIFDGIIAVQPAELIPLPENGRTDRRTPDAGRTFESSSPDL